MRVALTETFWRRTRDSDLVSFGENYSVSVYLRGTDDLATLWSQEAGGVEVDQPLLTDSGGRARGDGDVLAWIEAGRYDIEVGGVLIPWEAAAGDGDLSALATDSEVESRISARAHRAIVPDVVAFSPEWQIPAGNTTYTANSIFAYICRVPKTGHLRDVMVFVQTASGNVGASIYSAPAGSAARARKWTSGSVACPAAGAWRIIGDPNLAVVEGELLTLALAVDNATASFGRYTNLSSGFAGELPAAYVPEGGIRTAVTKASSFPDAGESFSGFSSATSMVIIVARVT